MKQFNLFIYFLKIFFANLRSINFRGICDLFKRVFRFYFIKKNKILIVIYKQKIDKNFLNKLKKDILFRDPNLLRRVKFIVNPNDRRYLNFYKTKIIFCFNSKYLEHAINTKVRSMKSYLIVDQSIINKSYNKNLIKTYVDFVSFKKIAVKLLIKKGFSGGFNLDLEKYLGEYISFFYQIATKECFVFLKPLFLRQSKVINFSKINFLNKFTIQNNSCRFQFKKKNVNPDIQTFDELLEEFYITDIELTDDLYWLFNFYTQSKLDINVKDFMGLMLIKGVKIENINAQ